MKELRSSLASRWDLQISYLGAPKSEQFGEALEIQAAQMCLVIKQHLEWNNTIWKPILDQLSQIGFNWNEFHTKQPLQLGEYPEITKLKKAIITLLSELETRKQWLRRNELKNSLFELQNSLSGKIKKSTLALSLSSSIEELAPEKYAQSFAYLEYLWDIQEDYKKRQELLNKLEKYAPNWAKSIYNRHGVHGQSELPAEDVYAAWTYAQLYLELQSRSEISLVELQDQINTLSYELKKTTNELIEELSWIKQLERVSLPEQQALVGYLDIVKRIGQGKGKRASRLKAEAKNKMRSCKRAVPVWIMPLSWVAETFDPQDTKFDVVIIDEASQCDVMGLIALYLGKKVLIVGDNEQVSPLAIGQKLDIVTKMIDQHLQGIPNKELYDGTMSVYDLARHSFSTPICLLEHFRCAPEIIQFSNHLSYNGKIKPLRDSTKSILKPPVISYRVDNADCKNKMNKKEAATVASLVLAITQIPEYDEKTIGVISLLGDEQAIMIDTLLRKNLNEKEYAKREIICGTAAQFQGDERDIVFLSLVDAPTGEPLKKRGSGHQDMFKKRYNVATSRAKDQLWVIHSLNYQTDLKPGDLRRRLIEFAEDPNSINIQLKQAESQAESPFEREILGHLIRAGYNVTPQWTVGYYRIDMVVEGNGKQLAIECDGERFHPLEKIGEDMARQAILERLGWTFYRIRGSQYYKDPQTTIQLLFDRLNNMGIEPTGNSPSLQPTNYDKPLKHKIVRKAQEIYEHLVSEDGSVSISPLVPQQVPAQNYNINDKQTTFKTPETPQKKENFELKNKTVDADLSPSTLVRNSTLIDSTSVKRSKKNFDQVKVDSTTETDNLIKWVSALGASIWFRMSRWAKENNELAPWERSLLYSLGLLTSKGKQASEKQARQGVRIYNEALKLGFDPEEKGA